ncbi:zinc-ribbon domain-containing protein [Candidatus Pelagibacter sp.]|nr:zinc-ribbon domain-containing protein [Candidatus Pelagibacter sp.]
MIIVCNNCNKKFDIDSALIPEKGRLLQCNGCDHKWFFKKELIEEPIAPVKIKEPSEEVKPIKDESEHLKDKNPENIELLDAQINKDFATEETSIDKNKDINLDIDLKKDPSIDKRNYNILGLTIVFIISFIALIIVLDTFQKPISKYIPNIEFLLYSLYETINDIKLFLKDLI